jgi:short-subunit dehydrogenase
VVSVSPETPADGAALVTGASSGIGREFARLLAEKGHDVVLVARREERLRDLAAELEQRHRTRCLILPADLADPEAPERIQAAVREAEMSIGVLVNNAGLTPETRFLDQPWEWQAGVVHVMALAPLHLVYLFLPAMLERGAGHIVNVSSVGAWYTSTPTQTLYGATKAFVVRFTQTLGDEYPGRGVSFTAVCPGVTQTEILDMPVSGRAVKGVPQAFIDSPRKVAERGWEVAQAGGGVTVVGPTGKLTFAMLRFLPDRIGGKAIAKRLLYAYAKTHG